MIDMSDNTILKVENLKKYFPIRKGFFKGVKGYIKAVDDISFSIPQGKTLGLVGESGSGKTTAGRTILRALDPTEGRILFRRNGEIVDIAAMGKKQLDDIRSDIQMVFQNPYSSLNPRMPVLDLVAEPLQAHGWKKADYRERVKNLLGMVGLDTRFMERFPHAFSGGQRQRIGIARALALNPSLIVADEPVSSLDVSVQAQILNLMEDLQEKINLTYLFIAHDLGVVRHICDSVAVMFAGNLVEMADAEELFYNPLHPYTKRLLEATPPPNPREKWGAFDMPEKQVTTNIPAGGCAFAPRCECAEDVCWNNPPKLKGFPSEDSEHRLACHNL